MKIPSLLLCAAALSPVSSVLATVTATLPAQAVMWTNVADTATVALNAAGSPINPGTNFASFDPPVITQWDYQSLAFKARLAPGAPVTPLNDEAVWSTTVIRPLSPWLVLREGGAVPTASGATFGFASTLTVDNLQSLSNDWTVCAANTSTGGKIALANFGSTRYSLGESPTVPWADLRPPVCNNYYTLHPGAVMALWKAQNSSPQRGVQRWTQPSPGSGLAPTTGPTSWYTGFTAPSGPYKPNQTARVASPAISKDGWVASYARPLPPAAPNEVRLYDDTGALHSTVVREGAPAVPVSGSFPFSTLFGTIHNQLMAVSDSIVAGSELVAWQMLTMQGPPSTLTSLWCRRGLALHCLAHANQAAPDMPAGNFISSFYELQAVPDFSKPGEHWVFWGAMISPGNRVAIYRTHVGGIATPPDLIATNVPALTQVLTLTGIQLITAIDRYFSVNVHGTVLFKATCNAPAGRQQILVSADATNGHARIVRAQSGIATAGVPVPSLGGAVPAVNFELARPDQGPDGRGQAIGTQWLVAKVRYAAGQGIFWANGL